MLVISTSWGSEAGRSRQTHALALPYSLACHQNAPGAEDWLSPRSVNLFSSCSPFIPMPQTNKKTCPKTNQNNKNIEDYLKAKIFPRIVVSLRTWSDESSQKLHKLYLNLLSFIKVYCSKLGFLSFSCFLSPIVSHNSYCSFRLVCSVELVMSVSSVYVCPWASTR